MTQNIRLHLLAIPYTITRDEYSHDAFTGKVKRFAPMMRSRGFEVFHYGIETSESGANKDIELMSKAEWTKLRIESLIFLEPKLSYEEAVKKNDDITLIPNHHSNWSTPLSIKFNELLRIKLKENYRNNQTDIVCVPLSRMYENAIKDCNYVTIEVGIGYSGSYLNYRIFESYSWLSYTLATEKKAPQNYWFVVPHAFNTNDFELSLNPNPLRVGFLGRIESCKGVSIIVEIAKHFPHVEFVLCGGGNPESFLKSPNIIYKLPIHGKERSEYLGGCMAVLSPTIYLEPFGCSTVEAQICGTPVICADAGGMVETVEQFKTGLRCHTLADYCYGVQYALDGKFDRKYIRQRAVNLYDMYNLAHNYEYIFKSVLDIHIPIKNGWYSSNNYIGNTNLYNTNIYNTNVIPLPLTITSSKDNNNFCILLVGQMRTYDSVFIKNSYLYYLSKYECIDLYIYTWKNRGSSNRHGNQDINIKQNNIIIENELITYYSQFPFFNIKQIIIEDFDIFYENLSIDMKEIYNRPFKNHSKFTTSLPICYKYQQAVEHLKQFNIDYSYCMLLRPDFEFINEMPLFNQIEDNNIYFKHWHPRCIDHGWFGTSKTIINQLFNIYTNIKTNIMNIRPIEESNCNNEIIHKNTEMNNIKVNVINGKLNGQVCYDRTLILDNHIFIDNYIYTSLTNSVEININNKNINFKKIIPNKITHSWVGYNIKKGNYVLTFDILSSIDIDFPFIKSHSPICFHKTKFIKKNVEDSLSVELNIENDTIIIFIFDDYNNYADITFKNIKFELRSDIPLKIWQTWITKELPPNMLECVEKLKNQHPNFEHNVYSDVDCYNFIKEFFPHEVLLAYTTIIPGAYKSDLWRLCILYIYGGVYMDIKLQFCNGYSLNDFINNELYIYDGEDLQDLAVYNAFIISKKHNKLLLKCILHIVLNVIKNYYGTHPYITTGTVLLGKILKSSNKNYDFYLTHYGPKSQETIKLNKNKDIVLDHYSAYRIEQHNCGKQYYSELWKDKKIFSNEQQDLIKLYNNSFSEEFNNLLKLVECNSIDEITKYSNISYI
jgi:mannosyltransferase OCH1-like enzyme/glycosyltransferase involved in cell wall biosynthesis